MGITLVESIATLGIMSAVAVGTVVLSNEYTQDTRTAGAAEHMRIVAEATRAYVRDNRATVLGQASATSPALITVAMLRTSGYLPGGFSPTNAYDQTLCALVVEPTAGTLNTLVVAEGGRALDNVSLAHFSSMMGAGGGGRFSTSPTTIQGAGGGWSMPIGSLDNRANNAGRRCNGTTAGRVQIAIGTPVYAQWMDANDTADPGFLSRNVVPGNPGANTMQTNIDMGGNRITNLGNYVAGAACPAGTADGELGVGSRNEVLSCSGGSWARQGAAYWGTNVTTYAGLPACNASNMGETRRVTSITGLFVCNGLRWDVALNESNNFSLPQHLQVTGNARINGAADFYGTTTARATFNANEGIEIAAGKTINNPGRLHIEAGENLYLKPWSASGQVIVGGGGGNGSLTATGRVTANGSQALTGRSDNWSVIASDSAGGFNNAAKNSAGSIHANDVYVRSAGKWVSDIATGGGVTGFQVLANHPWSRDPQSHCRVMTRSAMVSIQGAGMVRATINGTEVVRSAGLADGGGGGYSETSAVTIGVPRNATVCGYSQWVFSGAWRGWYDNFKMVAYYLE